MPVVAPAENLSRSGLEIGSGLSRLKGPGSGPGGAPPSALAPSCTLPADVHLLRHGLEDNALAAALGCAPDALTQLRLCRRPGAALPSRTAAEDVAEIAARFGLGAAARGRGRRRLGTAPCRQAAFVLGARSPVE